MTNRFVDIARRLYLYFNEHNLPLPRVTLTFDSVIDAHRVWHSVLNEFPEWSLHPINKQHVEDGKVGIHGVSFEFTPMEPK